MKEMLLGEKLTGFFELLQKPVRSKEELVGNVRSALEMIAGEMNIGKVTVRRSAPMSRLRDQIDNQTIILYQSDCLAEEASLDINFRSGDGGLATLSYFPEKGYGWEEEERHELELFGNMILWAFRLEIMGELLQRTATMDLAGNIPNMSGFMGCLGSTIAQRGIGNYIGFYLNTHNFKYVNKVLPYQKADEVMRLYIHQLLQEIEADECIARLGGDNFVALDRKSVV